MTQRTRVLVAAGYVLGLLVLTWVLFGRPIPRFDSAGTWFYAGLAVLVSTAALTEPFYASPAACLANAIGAIFAATAFSSTAGLASGASSTTIRLGKVALFLFAIALIGVALGAIMTKDSTGTPARFSAQLARTCRMLGNSRVVFSAVFLGAVYAAYSRDPATMFALFLGWLVIVVIRPLEFAVTSDWGWLRVKQEVRGRVTGLKAPGLVEVHMGVGNELNPGDVVALGTDRVGGVVLDTSPAREGSWGLLSLTSARLLAVGDGVYETTQDHDIAGRLGPVEPGTDLTDLRFRIPGHVAELREGNLVSVELRGQRVLYQVVAARVRTESLDRGVEHRFIEATARKIGAWEQLQRRFTSVPWLPVPGAPVSLEIAVEGAFQADAVGIVPGSSYGIRVDAHLLVTHNTAILGILGIGKTYLAFELIRRVLAAEVKVIVLDITGQYAPHFRGIFPDWYESQSADAIATAIEGARNQVMQNVHEGGNIRDFRRAVRRDLEEFVSSRYRLKIYNPGAFDVTRQDSKMFSGTAALAPLTAVETTRVFAEELLDVLSGELSEEARMCLVLEEAHSLVPEWNSTTYEGDQRASNGTAKAVLQGRKYGLGVMLVTQRTANVTKTILNQCNTVFALRIYDATGMDFLRNYIGDSYADVLSGLEDRAAIVFGRASSCASPVIIRVNDHDQMLEHFWTGIRGGIPTPQDRDDVRGDG